jgi:hypothetical protein
MREGGREAGREGVRKASFPFSLAVLLLPSFF